MMLSLLPSTILSSALITWYASEKSLCYWIIINSNCDDFWLYPLCRPTCSSMTVYMDSGSTVSSRWRTPRLFSMVRSQLLSLAAGTLKIICFQNLIYFLFFLQLIQVKAFLDLWQVSDFICFFSSIETQRRSHGVLLVLNTLLNLLVSSLTKKRPLLIWRFCFVL